MKPRIDSHRAAGTAPLALALALAAHLPWSTATASVVPMIGAGAPPAVRDAFRFGDQRAALNRQLRLRGTASPLTPNRPAEVVPVGVIPPDEVVTPAKLVHNLVQREIVHGR